MHHDEDHVALPLVLCGSEVDFRSSNVFEELILVPKINLPPRAMLRDPCSSVCAIEPQTNVLTVCVKLQDEFGTNFWIEYPRTPSCMFVE